MGPHFVTPVDLGIIFQCMLYICTYPVSYLVEIKLLHMTADIEELSELPVGATSATRTRSGTSVIRRSSVPPRSWVGPTTN